MVVGSPRSSEQSLGPLPDLPSRDPKALSLAASATRRPSADGVAVADVAIAENSLQGVAGGVPQIQDCSAPGVSLVLADHFRFVAHTGFYNPTHGGRGRDWSRSRYSSSDPKSVSPDRRPYLTTSPRPLRNSACGRVVRVSGSITTTWGW